MTSGIDKLGGMDGELKFKVYGAMKIVEDYYSPSSPKRKSVENNKGIPIQAAMEKIAEVSMLSKTPEQSPLPLSQYKKNTDESYSIFNWLT